MVDDGPAVVEKGDENTSLEQIFKVHVRRRNKAPKFTIVPNITICQSTGVQFVPRFADILSAGDPTESHQKLTFSFFSVSCVFDCFEGHQTDNQLFHKFEIQNDGVLEMHTQNMFWGGY